MPLLKTDESRKFIEIPEVAPNSGLWRFFVKARDNYTCQECGLTQDDIDIEAHHLGLSKDRLLVSDGKTLCYKCHAKAHNARPRPPRHVKPENLEITISFGNIARLLNVSTSSLHKFVLTERTRRQEIERNISYDILLEQALCSKKELPALINRRKIREKFQQIRSG